MNTAVISRLLGAFLLVAMTGCSNAPVPELPAISQTSDQCGTASERETVHPLQQNLNALRTEEESPVVKFAFLHPASTGQEGIGDDAREIPFPETEFGAMLLDSQTGRYVYRFWYDGVHEKASLGRFVVDYQRSDQVTPEQYRTVLKAAAGFDGDVYWVALFPEVFNNSQHPQQVVKYADTESMTSQAARARRASGEQSSYWFDNAPIHGFMEAIGCRLLDRGALLAALTQSPRARRIGTSRFDMHSDFASLDDIWSYSVHLDETGLLKLDVSLAGGSSGHWPFPVPFRYRVLRVPATEQDLETFEATVTCPSMQQGRQSAEATEP